MLLNVVSNQLCVWAVAVFSCTFSVYLVFSCTLDIHLIHPPPLFCLNYRNIFSNFLIEVMVELVSYGAQSKIQILSFSR